MLSMQIFSITPCFLIAYCLRSLFPLSKCERILSLTYSIIAQTYDDMICQTHNVCAMHIPNTFYLW